MHPELRAAAERMRKHLEAIKTDSTFKESPYFANYAKDGGRRWKQEEIEDDECALIRAYLDEHPADDDEPVTEEWLRLAGFQRHRSDLIGWTLLLPIINENAAIVELCVRCGDPLDPTDDDICVSMCQGVPDDPRAFDDNVVLTSLPRKPTRGDVRRLCAALGITLKE